MTRIVTGSVNCRDLLGLANGFRALPLVKAQLAQLESPLLRLLEQMTKKVGLYRLKCNMDPEAAQVAYDGMQRKDR